MIRTLWGIACAAVSHKGGADAAAMLLLLSSRPELSTVGHKCT